MSALAALVCSCTKGGEGYGTRFFYFHPQGSKGKGGKGKNGMSRIRIYASCVPLFLPGAHFWSFSFPTPCILRGGKIPCVFPFPTYSRPLPICSLLVAAYVGCFLLSHDGRKGENTQNNQKYADPILGVSVYGVFSSFLYLHGKVLF